MIVSCGEDQKRLVCYDKLCVRAAPHSINVFLAFIKQLLSDVFWEDVDYLIVDTPPGTSDEHITVMENIKYAAKPEFITIDLQVYIYSSERNIVLEKRHAMEQYW